MFMEADKSHDLYHLQAEDPGKQVVFLRLGHGLGINPKGRRDVSQLA